MECSRLGMKESPWIYIESSRWRGRERERERDAEMTHLVFGSSVPDPPSSSMMEERMWP
jgi:hypothetical protein